MSVFYPGNVYAYGYDRASNRTSQTVNASIQSFGYNAANQRIGWTYDAAGNLLTYGYGSGYTYDALGRLTNNGEETLVYNGDGVLVQAGATIYTQDLAAPLAQILADGEATYLYGLDRLATIDATGARSWELHDALGSVRMSLADLGTPDYASGYGYSPFGVVASGAVPQPFGFTGELEVDGLQYLRARWYDPSVGVFVARDPFAGFNRKPYALHAYQYAYASPLMYVDPRGLCPEDEFFCGHDGLSEDPAYAEHDFSDAKALQDLGTTVDFIPGFGDAKGIHDCLVGR